MKITKTKVHGKGGHNSEVPGGELETSPSPSLSDTDESDLGTLSQWQLIRVRFARHRLALLGFQVLIVLYFVAVFAEFFAPTTKAWRDTDFIYCPPQLPKFNLKHGLYVQPLKREVDPITLRSYYVKDERSAIPLGFFVKGEPYELWGLFPMNRHFMGMDSSFDEGGETGHPRSFFFLGADRYGHDIFSRDHLRIPYQPFHWNRFIFITFILGVFIGGISGYLSGKVDTLIQRVIEIINSFPQLPMWLALAAVMPAEWSALGTYFAITIVLSLLNWTGLARVVRGKILALREEDYAIAARLIGPATGA